MCSEIETGTSHDVASLVCKLMNRSVAERTITKQEAMCELAKLPMAICSESIETVSLSGCTKFKEANNATTVNTILAKYRRREEDMEDLSLQQFFHAIKNGDKSGNTSRTYIPHFVGGSGQPKFPVTQSYARTVLLVHKPWSIRNPLPKDENFIEMFNNFLKEDNCPASVKIGYARAQLRAENIKRGIQEITSPDQQESNPTTDIYDEDVEVAHTLCHSLGMSRDFIDSLRPDDVSWGENYDWSKKQNKVNNMI